jgi:uroporphyrinogen decarboxylase
MSAMISIGSQSFLEALYLDHELVNAVMEAYCSWTAKVIRRVCDMGVDVIFMTDDFAFISGPFVSPASFRQWIVPYHKIAIKEISIPWILHSDGYIFPILKDLLALGIKGIHPIGPNCMDIRAFKRTYGDRICVIGNVNINILVL